MQQRKVLYLSLIHISKSVLDANYHAQYDKYAEYRGISESDAQKEVTEGLRTQIESAFSGMDVGDEMMDKYIEAVSYPHLDVYKRQGYGTLYRRNECGSR